MRIALIIGLVATIFCARLALAEADLVLVDKSDRQLYIMEKGKILRQFSIALGGNPKGHKLQEGDQKTPEGVYVLDYINENSAYHRSMHISYPTDQDRFAAKIRGVEPGGMIMIHGQKNGAGIFSALTQLFDWTEGCIALTNDEMDEFLALVPVGTTIHIRW
ncbi:MAG: L,D-transpeptidase family protein [Proteobacteria bacterium]|nr:L,D-transpeptidase family protein [Pseudomonadota bacterium]